MSNSWLASNLARSIERDCLVSVKSWHVMELDLVERSKEDGNCKEEEDNDESLFGEGIWSIDWGVWLFVIWVDGIDELVDFDLKENLVRGFNSVLFSNNWLFKSLIC